MSSPSNLAKDARIDLRLNLSQKEFLEQAAAAQGKRLSDFMIGSSIEAAEIALANQTHFELSKASIDAFLASLEEEPQVLPKLKELFERKSVFE